MSFVHPAFLWALSVLAIPVLIHLFQLRRFKRIDFPNVRLLSEVSRQTRARKKVQHWLVLLARCLALAALVLAFAQPYIPGTTGAQRAGTRAVSIYIDDSYSMDGQNADGRLLDEARRGAQEAVMAHGPSDRFQVLTGAFQGRQQVLVGRDEALQAAAQAEAAPYTRALSKVMLRQREALATSDAPVRRAILFTDLQRGIADVDAWVNDTTVPVTIVPLQPASTANLSIDSVRFASPVRRMGQEETVHVTITNHGDQELVNRPLRLTIDGLPRALASFSIGAATSIDTSLRFINSDAGRHWGEVSIDDAPVTFDDRLSFAYTTVEHLRVMLVGESDALGDRAVSAVFSGDSTHRFARRNLRELDLGALGEQDLIVLNALSEMPSGTAQVIDEFVANGGSVALFPASGGDPARFADFLARFRASAAALDTGLARVDRIDLDLPFYRDVFATMPRNVDLPFARERWALRMPAGSDILLRTKDGLPYLARVMHGKGSLYLCAAPLADAAGNLTRHALFATSLLRMAELSKPMGALYHTVGSEAVIPVEGLAIAGDSPPHLLGPGGVDLLPELRPMPGGSQIALHDDEMPPGIYALTTGSDTVQLLAFNLARIESDLAAFAPDELESALEARGLTSFTLLRDASADLSLRLAELDQGRKLWKWFILLALLFLAIETLLLRTRR